MPYLRSRLLLLQTHGWSHLLPLTHVPHQSAAIPILKRWVTIKRENVLSTVDHQFTHDSSAIDDCWPHKIHISHRVTHHKSTFQAHATNLPDATLMSAFLNHLTSLPCSKRVTHCMYAYRSTQRAQGHEKVVGGQDDGGESGSGNRLSRLLELSSCQNVIVVVFRWYGGTKLGSDRWKCISQVAKEALKRGGFMRQGASQEEKTDKLTKHSSRQRN